MSLIDDIKADREAGTPGPWVVPDQTWRRDLTVEIDGRCHEGGILIPCPGSGGAMSYTDTVCKMDWSGSELWLANARRIARVPTLEAKVLAAEAMMKHAAQTLRDIQWMEDPSMSQAAADLDEALTAYREAGQ